MKAPKSSKSSSGASKAGAAKPGAAKPGAAKTPPAAESAAPAAPEASVPAAPAPAVPAAAPGGRRRINWLHVSTVLSAVILLAAEVFGGTFAAGWAFAILFGLGNQAHWFLQAIFSAFGLYVMVAFVRSAQRIEPFTTRE